MNVPSKIVDRQTFLATVRQSGLLTEQQLSEAERLLEETSGGRAAGRILVEKGLLTKFQAERLLAGRSSGYILGQYKILDQLGRGGMGQVFKAEHRTMSRIVALKVLAPGFLDTERAQDMFLREVRAVASLVHPNIVTAFDANTIQGRHYLVLEFVDGPNLDQLVKEQGPLPIGLACDYILQVTQGLQCAHSQRMVHRDIKPANLLVQRRGTSEQVPALVKISDFGLARLYIPTAEPALANLSATIVIGDNTIMGTPDYLSPEQARSLHTTDIRSDIYSLGCTFHFLLSGQVPYPGGSSLEKLIRHSSESLAPMSRFRSDVPPKVEEIIRKMVAKAPEDRFQTPAEVAAALAPFAVRGTFPWKHSLPEPSFVFDVPQAPRDNSRAESDIRIDFAASDEISTIDNTLGRDTSPTPCDVTGPLIIRRTQRKTRSEEAEGLSWIFWLIVMLVGVGGGILAAVAYFLWK